MQNNWFSIDPDGGASPYIFPTDPLVSRSLSIHLISQIASFLDHSGNLYNNGSGALREAFNCISKFTGAILFLSHKFPSRTVDSNSGGSHALSSQLKQSGRSFSRFSVSCRLDGKSSSPAVFCKVVGSLFRNLFRDSSQLQYLPVLSLASAFVPPFDNLTSNAAASPLGNTPVKMHGYMDQLPCEVGCHGYAGLSFPDLYWKRYAVEPRTGIEFPMILDKIASGDGSSKLISELLVATGSRTMSIIKIKTLKIYAFGFYIHPDSLCEKLGKKYAAVPPDELNKLNEFYKDLLREDISMTVRLVVNWKGLKISSVRDAFEKSLRTRLLKTNPDTDFQCLSTFGSFFTQDIPLPVGTIIDFQRTTDGRLVTEIGGNQIGAVHSRDLCRAFFGMYVGDVPVSEQTKEEIGRNVVNICRDPMCYVIIVHDHSCSRFIYPIALKVAFK